jgi:hypothetical protein
LIKINSDYHVPIIYEKELEVPVSFPLDMTPLSAYTKNTFERIADARIA